MSTLANLKKSSSLQKLASAVKANNSKSNNTRDERYWQPEVDKAGNGFAVIRFLPAPPADGDDGLPWVKLYSHGFQGPGGWYIENSLTTLGQMDPVSEYNSTLWDSGIEANKELARKQKRRLSYVSNILVVKHAARPEDEGKVFLFSYGKKIWDKISYAIDPTEEDIEAAKAEGIDLKAVDIFSFWEGHNFNLKIRKVEGYRNYDKSEFVGMATAEGPAKGTPVAKNDAAIEEIWKKEYALKPLVAPDQFKSYAELEARLNKVLGLDGSENKGTVAQKSLDESDDQTPRFDDESVAKAAAGVKSKAVEVKKAAPVKVETPAAAEDDDMLAMFREMADTE